MHVFQEDDKALRKEHVKYWFGSSYKDYDDYRVEDDSYIVCYCGGRLIPLEYDGEDIKTAAVWHAKEFRGIDNI
jgi:hypothetical protein